MTRRKFMGSAAMATAALALRLPRVLGEGLPPHSVSLEGPKGRVAMTGLVMVIESESADGWRVFDAYDTTFVAPVGFVDAVAVWTKDGEPLAYQRIPARHLDGMADLTVEWSVEGIVNYG